MRTDNRLHTIDVATEGTASEIFQILGRLQAAGAPAHKVSTYRPSLDDVFLSVTGTGTAAGPCRGQRRPGRTEGDGPMSMAYASPTRG